MFTSSVSREQVEAELERYRRSQLFPTNSSIHPQLAMTDFQTEWVLAPTDLEVFAHYSVIN